jgi:hypothetical protein
MYDDSHPIDRTALDCHYSKLGTIADVYVDTATGRPEWLAIRTGLFGSKVTFAPATGAHVYEGDIVVRYDATVVEDAPRIETDEQPSVDQEFDLFRHYGIDLTPMTGNGARGGRHKAHPSGPPRLRRWIESEDPQVRLPVQHEKVRVITEPETNEGREQVSSASQALQ